MILITGASSGIGQATAEVFAEKKQNLFLVARRLDRLEEIKGPLENKHGITVTVASLDVSDAAALRQFTVDQASLLRKVTVLVNNAGLAKGRGPIQEGNPDDWEVMWNTNVRGLLNFTRYLLPFFLENKAGHIVNLGSVAGRWIYPNGNVYCATKAAVHALSESMRLDLVGTPIRVTEISPGMVETEFSLVRFQDRQKAEAVYAGMTPLTPRDVAEAIEWSVSRPGRVTVQEMVIYPTDQAAPTVLHRTPQ